MSIPTSFKQNAVAQPGEIEYPTGDGEPMAETAIHRDLMLYAISALRTHFADRDDIWISGNDFIYFIEGDPNRRVSPDTYVVFDVGNEMRDCYKVWEEGEKAPDVVFEFTSKTTRNEDTEKKMRLYEQTLRVSEYFLFDPTGDYLNPILQGYRLTHGHYEPIPFRNDRLISEQLGMELVLEAGTLRFVHPLTRWRYLTPAEEHERAEAELKRANHERERAETESHRAEMELERANQERERAEMELERANHEQERAETERQRADREQERADHEANERTKAEERSRLAEGELTRLRAELEALRNNR